MSVTLNPMRWWGGVTTAVFNLRNLKFGHPDDYYRCECGHHFYDHDWQSPKPEKAGMPCLMCGCRHCDCEKAECLRVFKSGLHNGYVAHWRKDDL